MKIALLTEEFLPQITGVSVNLMHKLEVCNQLNIQVRLYCPDYGVLPETYPDYKDFQGQILKNITVVPFPSEAAGLGKYNDIAIDPIPFSFKKVEDDIISFEPDLIHVDSPERLFIGFLSIPGKKAARQLNVPLVSFYHTHFTLLLPTFKKIIWWTALPGVVTVLHRVMIWVYRHYPLVLAASEDTKEQLESWKIPNVKLDKFIGIELSKFTPRDFSIKKEKPVNIINVGRLDPDKDVSFLLKVCSAVNQHNKNCHFTFIGHGIQAHLVEKWVSEHSNSTFLGKLNNEETAEHYRNADIFITVAEYETFGMTLLEAAASGLPIIGARSGAVKDRIEDGQNGYLVAGRDVNLFVEKITALIKDQNLRLAFSKRSVEIAKQYSNDEATYRLINIWKEEVGKNKSLPVS